MMKTLDDLMDMLEAELIRKLTRIRRIQLIDECIRMMGGETEPLTEQLQQFRFWCSMTLISMEMIMDGRY